MKTSRSERGQILIIVAAGMVALVVAVGLVIDGGHLWARQRDTQNGTDAAAEAGAIQLVNVLRGSISVSAGGTAVCNGVRAQAAQNNIEVETAYYTDLEGNRLSVAIDETGTCHSIPPCAPPACAGNFASGVEVDGLTTPETILMQIVGFDEVEVRTEATAIGGYVANPCQDVEGCTILPITPPVTVTTCNRSNRSVTQDEDGDGIPDLYEVSTTIVTIPFCRTAAGSIGWLDFTGSGGGVPEIEESIRNPTWVWPGPDWYEIAQTGDINSSLLENAINEYTNQVVYLPMFDGFCSHDPDPDECPSDDHAGGTNIWYHLPKLASFQLLDPRDPDGTPPRSAWITGNDAELRAICGEVSESGATSCLTGRFVDFVLEGEVGALPGGEDSLTTTYGIQLIH